VTQLLKFQLFDFVVYTVLGLFERYASIEGIKRGVN